MQLKLVILIAVILMSSGASALKFDENIKVNGGGYMHSQTNTEQSSDLIEGHGAQNYHRSLTSQLGLSSLASEYSLKSDNLPNAAYFPNRYQISMKSPTGLRHTISVYGSSGEGAGNLSSVSRIAFDPAIAPPSSLQTSDYALSTSYAINGNGSLSEAITDSSMSKHPTNIAETSIDGDFTVNSRLTNSLTLPASEAQSQSAKLDSVTPVSDMPQQSESSIRIADLETMLNRGLITQDDYLIKMEEMLTTSRITADQYATSLKSAFDSGLITLSYVDYSALLQKASSAALKDLNTLVNNTLITPEEYLITLKQMLDNNRITEVDYLSAIYKTKAATKISEIQYPTYKMITLNEMESKYAESQVIDWTTYSSRLNAMLSLGLINQDDYTGQIQKSSNDTISIFWKLLSNCLINKKDFSDNLKEMKVEGRIDDNRYNEELGKLGIFDTSNCP
jgi:hypothetical protein